MVTRQKPALTRDVATGDIVSLKWYEEVASTIEWLASEREWVSVTGITEILAGGGGTDLTFSTVAYDERNLLGGIASSVNIDLTRWTHGLYVVNAMCPLGAAFAVNNRVSLDLIITVDGTDISIAAYDVPYTSAVHQLQAHVTAVLDFGRILREYGVYEFSLKAFVWYTDTTTELSTTSADNLIAPTLSILALTPTTANLNQRYTIRDGVYGIGTSAWVAPTDWTVGSPSVAKGNELAEACRFSSYDRPYCGLSSATPKSLATGTFASIGDSGDGVFGSTAEKLDWRSLHSTSTNPSRITVGTTGVWLVWADVHFPTNASGDKSTFVSIRKNGVSITLDAICQATWTRQSYSVGRIVSCSATTDYFEVLVWHNYGSTQNVGPSATWARMDVQFHAVLLSTGTAAGDSYTAPYTLDVNDTYATTQHNRLTGDIRWFTQDRPAWILRNNSATSGTALNATYTAVSWATEDLDRGGLHSASSDTVTIGISGVYLIGGGMSFQTATSGSVGIRVRKNGTTTIAAIAKSNKGTASINPSLTMAPTPVHLTAGDTLVMQVWQTTGASVTLGDASDTTGWSACFYGVLERRD